MCDLRPEDFAKWRDDRLQEVSGPSVRREMDLLRGVLSIACKEWGMIQASPISEVKKPPSGKPRDRLPTKDEIEKLKFVAGSDLSKAQTRAVHAFMFAGETAMRAGEIVGLTWDKIDIDARVAELPETKNGTMRRVPLSSMAVEMLQALPQHDQVFNLSSAQLDALWRKIRDKASIKDLRFHDSRHWAITRLAKKLDVMDLARMVGHRNLSQLLTYYNEKAEDLALRLD